jgi:uncharacterized protein
VFNQTRRTLLASSVEVPATDAARRRGLLGRSSFPVGCCLWLVPCSRVHGRGMAFSIDLVWLDGRLGVVRCGRLNPGGSSGYFEWESWVPPYSVLELPFGVVMASGTRAGDSLQMLL